MKKGKTLKKAFAIVLTFALIVTAVCAAFPTSALNLVSENASGFEEYIWHMSDNNDSKDVISYTTEGERDNIVVVTKGAAAKRSDNYWPSLASRYYYLEAGKSYQVSFDIKGSDANGYYSLGGYMFDASLNAKPISYNAAPAGATPTEWTTVSATFTADSVYTANEIRIIFKGNAGTKMYIDNFDIKVINTVEKVIYNPVMTEPEASLENWNDTTYGYSDPDNAGISDVEIVSDGADDCGSVHIFNDYENNTSHTTAAIAQLVKTFEAGKTYTLTFKIKGNTAVKGDTAKIHLAYGNATFDSNGSSEQALSLNASDWTEVSYDFTVNSAGWFYVEIQAGGYAGADFYIDNIAVCEKGGNGTNLFTNGNFCTESTYATISLNETETKNEWATTGSNDVITFEVVSDGYDDPGALHAVHADVSGTDGRVYMRKDIPAGDYTFKFYVKGTSTAADPIQFYISGENTTTYYRINETAINTNGEWVEMSKNITLTENCYYLQFKLGGYVWATDLYLDNIQLINSSGENILGYMGNFCPAPTAALTLNDGYIGSNQWYRIFNTTYTADTEDRYMSIVEDGADDAGSLYVHNVSPSGDMVTAVEVNAPTGTYTVKMKVKGSVGLDNQTFRLFQQGYDANSFDITPSNTGSAYTYSDWTEISSSLYITNTGSYPVLQVNFSQYNWATDFYIDNIEILDANGNDVLGGIGDFCEKEKTETLESAIDYSAFTVSNVPGFDIGMLNTSQGYTGTLKAVPQGSYDGSTALSMTYTGDSKERYFQLLNNNLGLGDYAVKASGYYKVTEGNVIPQVWIGAQLTKTVYGYDYLGIGCTADEDNGATFTTLDNGWVYFEIIVDESYLSDESSGKVGISDISYVNFMFGIDDDTGSNKGTVLFDNLTAEIICSADAGDANNDGYVNLKDLVHLKKYAAGNLDKTEVTRNTFLGSEGSGAVELVAIRNFILGNTEVYGG